VKFVATDPAHNAQTIPQIWPEGAATFKGEMSKDVTLKIEKPGVYGVKCLPHYPMGMVALVVAGDPVNANQVEAYEPPSPAAKKRIDALSGKLPG
jgi:pseudoazurin